MSKYVVESGSSSSGATSKRPYDAMVYKDADSGYTIAVDGNGNVIKKVLSASNIDDVVIQAAINGLSSGGRIYIRGGEYTCSNYIHVNYIDNISIYGDGPETYLIRSNHTSLANGTIIGIDYSDNFSLRDVDVFGMISWSASTYLGKTAYTGIDIQNVNILGSPHVGLRIWANTPVTLENVYISHMKIEDTGSTGVWFGWTGSTISDVYIEDVKVFNAGDISGYTGITDRGQYSVGFDLNEGNQIHRCTLVGCHAEGCWESGFHQEYYDPDEVTGILYLNCTSKNNGQKTKTSSGIVYYNDLTQTTPFDCTFVGTTHSETSKLRCRLVSDTDSITAFSIRFKGVNGAGGAIDETITEATPGVTHETNGWSFYTTSTWKADTAPTTITVQSVVGASSGDTICVGQDCTYGAGFLASNATYIGCKSEDELYGFNASHKNAMIISCCDNNSTITRTANPPLTNMFKDFVCYTGYVPTINNKYVFVSSNSRGEFTTIAGALSAITDATVDNQYTIVMIGDVEDTSIITWKSYVNLIGNGFTWTINTNTNGIALALADITNIRIQDVNVVKEGSSTAYPVSFVIGITGSSDDTVSIHNSSFVNNSTGSYYTRGLSVTSFTSPRIYNCRFVGGSTTSACAGAEIISTSTTPTKLVNCTFVGGSGGIDSHGLSINGNCSVVGCECIGGSLGGFGLWLQAKYSNDIVGCICTGGNHAGSAIQILGSASPHISNCVAQNPSYSSVFSYSGTDYSILPFASEPYFIMVVMVVINTAGGAGSVVNVGTTDGGNEIATFTSDTTGYKYVIWNCESLIANAPFYAKPTDTNTRFNIYYTVGYNNPNCYGIYLDSTSIGKVRITNSKFYSNKASSAGYISTVARTAGQFLIENCSFESAGTYDLEGQTSGVVPVYNCTFGRGSLNNILLPGQGTAATITAGNTYVDVTHSLASTPTKVRVTPTTNLGTRSFWADTKGAATFRININSSDVIDHTFDWEAEV